MTSGRTWLYRHFDATGTLLYVGIAKSVDRRTEWHRYNSPWFDQVAATEVIWFNTRAEAEIAEAAAIVAECPLFNVMHAKSRHETAVSDFIYSIGRAEFERSVGVMSQVVSRAIKENGIPCHWFINVRNLCDRIGVECPEHLFKWLPPVSEIPPVEADQARGIPGG
jgi:hypothetical protein